MNPMTPSFNAYQRAVLLNQHGRHADAERELRQALAQDPHYARAHAMLALTLTAQVKFREASEEAEAAVGLEPDLPFGHYAMAKVMLDRHRPADAAKAIDEAIRHDPQNPDYYALLASIRMEQRSWADALAAADRGLQVDAEHSNCVNLRAMALVKLGRNEDAAKTVQDALQKNPENAVTHANKGWALLHQNQPKQAMFHFRESLRLDPTSQWARAGIVEALKARNPIYRLMLMYFLWMSKLGHRVQWAILVGGYFGYRFALDQVHANPSLGKYLWPLIVAYCIFAALSWLADPLFNLMLRLHPYGKYALFPEQRLSATLTGITLLIAILAAIAGWYAGSELILIAALFTAFLVIPVSVIFRCSPGWPRWTMAGIAIALILVLLSAVFLGLLGIHLETLGITDQEQIALNASLNLCRVYIYGVLISSFAANYLLTVKPKR